ncbi:serine/threonine-protein kinase [Streptomyces sp.]|uniref:serine/threonine-protein kinase n=1 Tax=Streptomyces sp. TaxID=1931 RepID=UPI0028113253|nr:serine/threonine-protein kinase [Streptomyces sp.]
MGRAHVSTHRSVGGRYRLVEITHRETNSVCWYADDLQTGRPCLVTRTGLPEDPGGAARRVPSRVLRTTESVSRLCPGRIATVVDAVGEDGSLWTVTAWIDGTPLGEVIAEQGTLNHVRTARIALELLDVLDAAHAEGITHGELSPGQVFVREGGPVVVTGYGLAGSTSVPRLTAPSYAAPEQARDERTGPAADLWALGAILYTMLEGRPPFRDRGRPASTLKGVDRLPLRTPVRAGPLTRVVQGLLRKDPRERLTRQVVREVLTRVLSEDPGAAPGAVPGPRLRGGYTTPRYAGREWSGRTMVLGTTLAVVTVAVAVLAATQGLPGTGSAAPAPTAPTASAPGGPRAPGDRGTARPPAAPAPAPTPPPSGTAALPPGYRTYRAPEGFSVALPEGWERLGTSRAAGLAYRVTFGADGDPRTLAVTYSERVGPDAVAVWRDDVEPRLERSGGYERIGSIRATTYQGREAADMEWYAEADGSRLRTFGRGLLLGGGRGFSLRWTTPAADWGDAASREALRAFLRTFRPASG